VVWSAARFTFPIVGSNRQPVGRGNRSVPVATKITGAEKALLDQVVAEKGITASDALREGLLLYLAIETFTVPDERPGAIRTWSRAAPARGA